MAAVGKVSALIAVLSFLVIMFYLIPNKNEIENVQTLGFALGGLFFLTVIITILAGKRHARRKGWIS